MNNEISTQKKEKLNNKIIEIENQINTLSQLNSEITQDLTTAKKDKNNRKVFALIKSISVVGSSNNI